MFDLVTSLLAALDPTWFMFALGIISLGGQYSKQSSTSSSDANSGFLQPEKAAASATANSGLANLFTSADDLYRNKAVPQFNMSQNIPGLFKEQEGAANAFANKMFANASAGGALRGQFSMNNTPGIVGSAITNMGATLLPMISQNLKDSMLIPETIRTQRFNNVMSPLQALIAGLGSTSTSRGQSEGWGTGGNMSLGGGSGTTSQMLLGGTS